jgi:hypothetical protein
MANEKRLIDANAEIRKMRESLVKNKRNTKHLVYWVFDAVISVLEKAPTVDAVEVVHGYWIDSYNADHMGRIIEHSIDCSVCENVFKDDSREVVKRWKERFKVCPFCGAIMDGERRDT